MIKICSHTILYLKIVLIFLKLFRICHYQLWSGNPIKAHCYINTFSRRSNNDFYAKVFFSSSFNGKSAYLKVVTNKTGH
jgi:hypothetical protein